MKQDSVILTLMVLSHLRAVYTCPKLKEEVLDPSLNLFSQEDPQLIEILKEKYLVKPSGKKLNLSDPVNLKNLGGQHGQPYLLEDKYFK